MISFFRVPQHRSRFLFRILLFSLTLTTACANTAETNASFNHTWVYWLIGIGTGLLLITVGYGIALFNYNQQLQTAVTKRTLSLQESEEKLSALLENSHASIWAIDKQYRYILGNKTFQTGLNSELGWDIATGESVLFDHLPPAEKAEWQAYYDKALEGKSFQVERKNSYPSQPQWSEYYFGPIKDKTGQIAGVTIVALDITKRKEKEELLNKFHQIIAVTPDSISLVDTNYVYQIVNPAYMQRTTKSYDDIVGHSVSEVMGADVFEKLIKPEFDACLRGKTIHYQEWFTYVGEGRRFMDVTYAPYQSKTGGIDGVLVSARDLTSTRQAEDHLQQEMARFQTVWQISQDAMALSDENGVVIDANPAYSVLYGYDLDEIINHNFAVIFPEKSREWANEAYRKTFTNPEIPPVFESVVQRRDGTIRQVESRIRFIEENGGRTAMLSTIRDITEQKQAAAELQKITNNLEIAQQIAHIGSWEWDMKTNDAHWSDEMYRIHGREKALGTPSMSNWLDHYHPDDHERLLNIMQSAIEGKVPYEVEYRIFKEKDGEERIIRSQGEIVRNDLGEPVQLVGTAQDITKRRQAEKALIESNERFKSQFESTPIPTFIWEYVNQQFVLADFNPAVAVMTQRKAKQFLGLSAAQIYPDRPDILEKLHTCLQQKTNLVYETDYHARGTELDRVIVFTFSYLAPDRVMLHSQDITERVEAERALQASEANLRALIDAAEESVLLIEPDGVIVDCNESMSLRFDKTRDELLGTNAYDLVDTAVADYRRTFANQVIKTGHPVRFEDERTGHIIANSIYPVQDTQGQTIRLAIFGRDITEQKLTEEALRISEEQYRRVVTYSPVGIFVVQNGKYVFANPMGAQLLGYPNPDDILEMSALSTIASDSQEMVIQRLQNIAQNKNNSPIEMTILRKDGSLINTESTSIPIVFNDEPAALIIGQDVTERRRLERSLKDSERRLRILFDNARDNILVHRLDENNVPGRYIEVNESTCRTLGYTQEEMLQLTPLDTNSPNVQIDIQEPISDLITNGYASFETMGKSKDGRNIPFEINAHLLQIGDERLVMSISRDISERKQAEASLQKQTRQMQQIINSVPEGVLVLNDAYRIVMANPVALKDLLFLANITPGEKLMKVGNYPIAHLLESPSKGTWHEIEHNGRFFEAIARPLTGESQTKSWVLVINDVTQQRKIQTAVQQQERLAAIGQLAAGIAHDFNNILAVISLYSEVLLNESFQSPTSHQRLKIIQDQVKKASDLTQQMLDFSRSARLQPKPLDFIEFLTRQIDLLKRTLPENIAIDFTYDIGNYRLNADPTRLQQIIMNLAINARDAMPTGGALHFSLEEFQVNESRQRVDMATLPPGEWIAFMVSDTGTGIPDDVIDRVFEPFFTTKEPGKGTGLGLAQVYGIVKQHDGEVVVKSQPEQGTTFTIVLPAFAELADEPTEFISAPLLGKQNTILVVEDGEVLREVLAESLKSLNYRVITAVNGEEALAIYKEQSSQIDLILSDMIMPGISGETLFYKLKAQNPAVKMIILTGYAQQDKLQKLRLQGLTNWLFKPPSLEDLAEMVAKSLK